jgi:hypothetical protein
MGARERGGGKGDGGTGDKGVQGYGDKGTGEEIDRYGRGMKL